LYRGELAKIDSMVKAALPRATDEQTKMHLDDVAFHITQALDPKAAAALSAVASRGAAAADSDEDFDEKLQSMLPRWKSLHTKQKPDHGPIYY